MACMRGDMVRDSSNGRFIGTTDAPPDTRVCRACGKAQPLDQFTPAARSRFGKRHKCLACTYKANREYRRSNPAFLKKITATKLDWRLKNRYRISAAEYFALLAQQKGSCAICRTPPDGKRLDGRRLCVDHDHVTGEVRGLLCKRCNFCLGYMMDSVEVLLAAVEYLKKHRQLPLVPRPANA